MDLEIPTGIVDSCGKAVLIRYREIPDFVNDDFFDAYHWWSMCKVLDVPPYDGGWMEWPADAIAVMAAFNIEQRIMDEEERNK